MPAPHQAPEHLIVLLLQAAVAAGKLQSLELGSQECREDMFCLDPAFTYLNHGSYGAAYK